MSTRRIAVLSTLAVLSCWLAVPSFADSQARIVRLSQVDGDVQIDRNIGQGYEKAFINLPVTQGTKLRAGQDARAEIEFEDGSTLRITPGTVVEFPELARRDSGARASSLELQEGTAYLNFKGDKGGRVHSCFWTGQARTHQAGPPSHRAMTDVSATVAVFNGDVEVASASGRVNVEKKHSATFALTGAGTYTLANNLAPDPYDEWDKQLDKYHQQYSVSNSFSPYGYGASDLSYYGSFYNIPGYGMMWQPYLVGAGWDPFMNGAWMWYPGAGYAWISAYPWGWTPYRYGSWTYLNAYGWFWQPGSTWAGWNTGPRIVNLPKPSARPDRPPRRDEPCWSTALRRRARCVRSRTGRKFAAALLDSEWPEAVCAIWERSLSRWSGQHAASALPCMPRRLHQRCACRPQAQPYPLRLEAILRCTVVLHRTARPRCQSPHERWRRGRVSSQPARQSPLARGGSSRVCRT